VMEWGRERRLRAVAGTGYRGSVLNRGRSGPGSIFLAEFWLYPFP
jgi:hypothetical protein